MVSTHGMSDSDIPADTGNQYPLHLLVNTIYYAHTLEELSWNICRDISNIVGSVICALDFYDERSGTFVRKALFVNGMPGDTDNVPDERSPAYLAVTGMQEVTGCPGGWEDEIFDPTFYAQGLHSVIAVPVVSGNRPLGALTVGLEQTVDSLGGLGEWLQSCVRLIVVGIEKFTGVLIAGDSEARAINESDMPPVGMFRAAPGGELKYADTSLAAMFGYGSPQEMIDDDVELIGDTAGSLPETEWVSGPVMESFGRWIFEVSYTRMNGESFDARLSIWMVHDMTGGEPYLEGYIEDITGQTGDQRLVREGDDRYRFLFTAMTQGFVYFDADGRVVSVNPAFERLTGIDRDDILGEKAGSVMPDIVPDILDRYTSVVTTGVPERMVYFNARRNNHFEVMIFRPAPGQCAVTFLDVTDRIKAYEALKKSESRYRDLFNNASDAIFINREDGTVLDANHVCCALLGASRSDLLSCKVEDFFTPLNGRHWKTRNNAYQDGESEYIEGIFTGADKEPVPVEISRSVIEYSDGPAYINFTRDTSERKRLEKQYLQAQKMENMAHLAGGVAHDFNNVLTAILGYADLALLDAALGDPSPDNIRELKRTAERAAHLTRQLLAFSRHQIIEPKIVNLNVVLLEMEKMLHRLIHEHNELVRIPKTDLWPVRVDIGQIEQVLTNLVVNARDAMPDGGRITVETDNVLLDETVSIDYPECEPGEYVKLSVSDTGCGIDDDTLSHIFEPFFTTKQDKGTGLGLATCYGIIRQSDGFMTVESEPGDGAAFSVYLPRAVGDFDDVSRAAAAELLPRGDETVLVVEDEGPVRKMASRLLRDLGYTVLESVNGRDAEYVIKQYSSVIHLLVTDVVMPHAGGRELAHRIRRIYPEIKVIYMSGYTDHAMSSRKDLKAGEDFMQKPFSAEDLALKVREILD